MLKISVTKQAARFQEKLKAKQKHQVGRRILALSEDPDPPDSKRLRGSVEGHRRADVGEYRIIYRVDGGTLVVSLIGKRNDDEVYKEMKRRGL
jgi:mRNA interferase RelE/StbE